MHFFLLFDSRYMKYYHAIYIVLKYFASFTGNENDIFEVNSRIQLWRNIFKYGGKKKKKFMEFVFFQVCHLKYVPMVNMMFSILQKLSVTTPYYCVTT